MLSKKSQELLLKALKFDDTKITELLGDAEVETTIPTNIFIFDEESKTELLNNHAKQNKKAIQEILIKDMKETAGLEFDGKTPEKFIEALRASVLKESNVSVDEKVKERDGKIKQLQDKLSEKDTEISSFKSKSEKAQRDSLLLKHFPKDRNDNLTDEDYLTLLNNNATIHEEDGVQTFVFKGKKFQDDKLNPIPIADAISMAFKESNWVKKEGDGSKGRGAGLGDSKRTPNTVNTLSEAKEYAKTQGWEITGEKFQSYLKETIEANKDFNFSG